MSKIVKCRGCGAVLQTTDATKVGFAASLEHTYCKACYQLLHYGIGSSHFHPEDLPKLESDSLVLMISSVLHLDRLFSYPVYRYQPDAKFVYIINQIDLLPKSTNLSLFIEKITKIANEHQVPFIDIILMSSKNPYDVDQLKSYLKQFREKHIYLVGVQNSGKTTIFKALTADDKALAFKKAGLTQETLTGNFQDQIIYDMPGLYQQGYLHQLLSYEVYKNLIPDKEIKPKIYQMKRKQSLCIEGLFTVTIDKEDATVVLYVDPLVKIHKTNEKRLKDLLEHKEEHFKVYADQYEEKNFKIPAGKYQITFADMGFLHMVGPNHVKLIYAKGLHISLTEALFI